MQYWMPCYGLLNSVYKIVNEFFQYRSHKHIAGVLQVLEGTEVTNTSPMFQVQVLFRNHKHITTSQPMRMFCKFLTELTNTSPMFCKLLKEATNTAPNVSQVLEGSHKHITTSQPMRMCRKFLKEVANTSPMFCKFFREVTNTSPQAITHVSFVSSIQKYKHGIATSQRNQ